MIKLLLSPFRITNFCIALVVAGSALHAQCTDITLPYTEGFSSVTLGATCSWTATSATTGAGWWRPNTAYAGGTAPEVAAYGDNACAGCVETISLTLASPLNTNGVSILQLGFKHKLYVTNQATSGSGSGTLRMQTSADGTTWTDRWTLPYTVSGTSLTSIASGAISVPTFDPASNTTYIRFVITGVMFKVWGWEIDDVSASSPVATGIQALANNEAGISLYPNPANDLLHVGFNATTNDEVRVELFDYTQHLAADHVYSIEAGHSNLDIPLTDLAPGIYFIKVTPKNSEFSTVRKFLKSND